MIQREMRIVAISRSGHHAILGWLGAQMGGPVHVVNAVRAGQLPFEPPIKPDTFTARDPRTAWLVPWQPETLDLSQIRNLLYNHENVSPEKLTGAWPLTAPVVRRDTVFVIRDPFNLWASLLQRRRAGGGTIISAWNFLRLWSAYAREFLRITQHHPSAVWVNYNWWFRHRNYRQSLATRLKLKFNDAELDRVPRWGNGSSFDGLKLQGRAQWMDVLNRWKTSVAGQEFRQILKPQFVKLAGRIYPELTQQVLRAVA